MVTSKQGDLVWVSIADQMYKWVEVRNLTLLSRQTTMTLSPNYNALDQQNHPKVWRQSKPKW